MVDAAKPPRITKFKRLPLNYKRYQKEREKDVDFKNARATSTSITGIPLQNSINGTDDVLQDSNVFGLALFDQESANLTLANQQSSLNQQLQAQNYPNLAQQQIDLQNALGYPMIDQQIASSTPMGVDQENALITMMIANTKLAADQQHLRNNVAYNDVAFQSTLPQAGQTFDENLSPNSNNQFNLLEPFAQGDGSILQSSVRQMKDSLMQQEALHDVSLHRPHVVEVNLHRANGETRKRGTSLFKRKKKRPETSKQKVNSNIQQGIDFPQYNAQIHRQHAQELGYLNLVIPTQKAAMQQGSSEMSKGKVFGQRQSRQSNSSMRGGGFRQYPANNNKHSTLTNSRSRVSVRPHSNHGSSQEEIVKQIAQTFVKHNPNSRKQLQTGTLNASSAQGFKSVPASRPPLSKRFNSREQLGASRITLNQINPQRNQVDKQQSKLQDVQNQKSQNQKRAGKLQLQQDSLINIVQPQKQSSTIQTRQEQSPVKRRIHIVSGPIKRLKSAAIRSVFQDGQSNPAKNFDSFDVNLPQNSNLGAYLNNGDQSDSSISRQKTQLATAKQNGFQNLQKQAFTSDTFQSKDRGPFVQQDDSRRLDSENGAAMAQDYFLILNLKGQQEKAMKQNQNQVQSPESLALNSHSQQMQTFQLQTDQSKQKLRSSMVSAHNADSETMRPHTGNTRKKTIDLHEKSSFQKHENKIIDTASSPDQLQGESHEQNSKSKQESSIEKLSPLKQNYYYRNDQILIQTHDSAQNKDNLPTTPNLTSLKRDREIKSNETKIQGVNTATTHVLVEKMPALQDNHAQIVKRTHVATNSNDTLKIDPPGKSFKNSPQNVSLFKSKLQESNHENSVDRADNIQLNSKDRSVKQEHVDQKIETNSLEQETKMDEAIIKPDSTLKLQVRPQIPERQEESRVSSQMSGDFSRLEMNRKYSNKKPENDFKRVSKTFKSEIQIMERTEESNQMLKENSSQELIQVKPPHFNEDFPVKTHKGISTQNKLRDEQILSLLRSQLENDQKVMLDLFHGHSANIKIDHQQLNKALLKNLQTSICNETLLGLSQGNTQQNNQIINLVSKRGTNLIQGVQDLVPLEFKENVTTMPISSQNTLALGSKRSSTGQINIKMYNDVVQVKNNRSRFLNPRTHTNETQLNVEKTPARSREMSESKAYKFNLAETSDMDTVGKRSKREQFSDDRISAKDEEQHAEEDYPGILDPGSKVKVIQGNEQNEQDNREVIKTEHGANGLIQYALVQQDRNAKNNSELKFTTYQTREQSSNCEQIRPETTLTDQRTQLAPNLDIPTTPKNRNDTKLQTSTAMKQPEKEDRTKTDGIDYDALCDVQNREKVAVMSAYDLAWIEKRQKVMQPVRTFVNLNNQMHVMQRKPSLMQQREMDQKSKEEKKKHTKRIMSAKTATRKQPVNNHTAATAQQSNSTIAAINLRRVHENQQTEQHNQEYFVRKSFQKSDTDTFAYQIDEQQELKEDLTSLNKDDEEQNRINIEQAQSPVKIECQHSQIGEITMQERVLRQDYNRIDVAKLSTDKNLRMHLKSGTAYDDVRNQARIQAVESNRKLIVPPPKDQKMQKSSLTAFNLRGVPAAAKNMLRSSDNKLKSVLHRSGEDSLNLRNLSVEHATRLKAFEVASNNHAGGLLNKSNEVCKNSVSNLVRKHSDSNNSTAVFQGTDSVRHPALEAESTAYEMFQPLLKRKHMSQSNTRNFNTQKSSVRSIDKSNLGPKYGDQSQTKMQSRFGIQGQSIKMEQGVGISMGIGTGIGLGDVNPNNDLPLLQRENHPMEYGGQIGNRVKQTRTFNKHPRKRADMHSQRYIKSKYAFAYSDNIPSN